MTAKRPKQKRNRSKSKLTTSVPFHIGDPPLAYSLDFDFEDRAWVAREIILKQLGPNLNGLMGIIKDAYGEQYRTEVLDPGQPFDPLNVIYQDQVWAEFFAFLARIVDFEKSVREYHASKYGGTQSR